MCCFYNVGAFITCRQLSHFNVLGKVIVLSCIVVGAVSCMDILNKAFRVLNLLPLLIIYSVLLTGVRGGAPEGKRRSLTPCLRTNYRDTITKTTGPSV